MNLILQRDDSYRLSTPGDLTHEGGTFRCVTLEDQLREILGRPAAEWKIKGETAIGAGIYELYLVDSPAHGKDTIRLRNVDGFDYVDMHSGVSKDSTEGCILVGSKLFMQELPPRISGGLVQGVLEHLKALVVPRLKAGERCTLEIRNPDGYGS